MRIFLAGDHYSGTGPANVTKYYIDNLPEGTLYQKRRSRSARAIEIILNTVRSDVVVYSGYSKQNILGLKAARILKKPSAYIMHGCVEHENAINLEPDETMSRIERQTLEMADIILAVSERFCLWLKEHYPEYADKIDFVSNGIDTALFEGAPQENETDRHMILSVGGGMPRKMIRYICDAVALLREDYDPDMYLCVVGDTGADSAKIRSYEFVRYLGIVPFEESVKLFSRAALFVQNSSFETFGLAPVEAILVGCSTLCSKEIGALDIINNVLPEDIIEKYSDPKEIAKKIKYLLENPNAKRLRAGIETELYSWKTRSSVLESKLSELVLKR